MQLKTVVLPAPLGPMRLAIESSSTSRSKWLTATRPPKRLVIERIDSRGGIAALPSGLSAAADIFLLVCVQFALAPLGGKYSLGAEGHHGHQQGAEGDNSILVDAAQDLWEPDRGDGSNDHAFDAADASDDNESQHVDGD